MNKNTTHDIDVCMYRHTSKYLFSLYVCILVFCGLSHPVLAADKSYSIAVVPQWQPIIVQRNWQPFLDEISQRSGVTLSLLQSRSIPEFENMILRGEPDFAYMNPYHAVMVQGKQNYIPLVRNGEKELNGILVVRKDSNIKHIKQLDGMHVVLPSPNAFGASLFIRAFLEKFENVKIIPRYVNTHANVYRNVIFKTAKAGGGVNQTLTREKRGVQKRLKVIYQTPSTAPHPLTAHPRIPAEIRNRVTAAIQSMWTDTSQQHLLYSVQLSSPVKADYREDYAPLEVLGLESFVERPSVQD